MQKFRHKEGRTDAVVHRPCPSFPEFHPFFIDPAYFLPLSSISRSMNRPPYTLRPMKWQYSPVTVSYQSENGTRLFVFLR